MSANSRVDAEHIQETKFDVFECIDIKPNEVQTKHLAKNEKMIDNNSTVPSRVAVRVTVLDGDRFLLTRAHVN